jgi:hypothetical protein
MGGFLTLMLGFAIVICLVLYGISWELQDSRTRPRFGAKIMRDCARLLGRAEPPMSVDSRPSDGMPTNVTSRSWSTASPNRAVPAEGKPHRPVPALGSPSSDGSSNSTK